MAQGFFELGGEDVIICAAQAAMIGRRLDMVFRDEIAPPAVALPATRYSAARRTLPAGAGFAGTVQTWPALESAERGATTAFSRDSAEGPNLG